MADFDALLARHDPDRRLAALFAPPDLRARLFTLYAFSHEVSKIPDTVSEPVIGEMRLAWARDAAADLYADPAKVRRHDVYEALADLRSAPGAPTLDELIALIEARAADLGQGAFPDEDEREAYVDRTAGLVMRLAARLAEPGLSGQAQEAVTAAGRLWGYAGLVRVFPALCAAGRPPLTEAEMRQAGLSEAQARRGLNPEAALKARAALAAKARDAGEALETARAALPASVFPAVGYAGLARLYLKMKTGPYAALSEPALIARQASLAWRSLTGRI
jgi:phytoene/squalene synthetase